MCDCMCVYTVCVSVYVHVHMGLCVCVFVCVCVCMCVCVYTVCVSVCEGDVCLPFLPEWGCVLASAQGLCLPLWPSPTAGSQRCSWKNSRIRTKTKCHVKTRGW